MALQNVRGGESECVRYTCGVVYCVYNARLLLVFYFLGVDFLLIATKGFSDLTTEHGAASTLKKGVLVRCSC